MTGDVRSQEAATTLLWVGFQNPGASRMGKRRRPGRTPQGNGYRDGRLTQRQKGSPWPALAVLALVLATASIVLLNQTHSGDPLKVRRELRKF